MVTDLRIPNPKKKKNKKPCGCGLVFWGVMVIVRDRVVGLGWGSGLRGQDRGCIGGVRVGDTLISTLP